MASVGTSIIGRPRRLSRHRRASPTHRSYPLTCEEPDSVTARKAVRRKLDRAGFPWATFHTLRRTVERQLMDANVDPRVIMAVMGHDPATSWASYVDHKSVDVSAAARTLA